MSVPRKPTVPLTPPPTPLNLTFESTDKHHVLDAFALPSPTSPTRPLARERVPLAPSRFLFVRGVPKDVTSQGLELAFAECGDLRGMFVRFQSDYGEIVLAYYDIRHAHRAHHQINTRILVSGTRLQAHFISPELIGVGANDGALRITASPGHALDDYALQIILASFGALRAFDILDAHSKVYHAEFFDTRDATSALTALNGRTIHGERLQLSPYPTPSAPEHPAPTLPQLHNTVPFPTIIPSRTKPSSPPPRCNSPDPAAAPVRPRHIRRTSNIYHFDKIGKATAVLHSPPRPRRLSDASEAAGLALLSPEPSLAPSVEPSPEPEIVHEDALTDLNTIDVARIERGDDMRTTVMIRNIPNRMTERDLLEFINNVCPRKIDFLYLRMDFIHGCNVGYAFVNFIRVKDLLHFTRTKLGTKWNLFSSSKVLGMNYANCAGKKLLIQKFRSSTIMEQRPAWRPKVFFSFGPKMGLPEEFPPSTHFHRKESAANNGRLYLS